MKNKLYKTAKAVAPSLLLLLFLLPACSDESSNTPDIPETKYAKLTITLGSADSAEPSYTKAMGDNDIFNTDSADLAHEHFIKDWWIVVMKLNNSSFSVDSIISNTTANNVDDDSETEVGMDLIIGETYKFCAFTNLDGLVTTDKDEVLNGLKGKSEADMLNLAVTMQEMDKYVKDATHTTPAEIPMSSYGYTHVITDDPNKNQLSICLFRLLGKVSIDVTNGTGKEVTLNKITMGKFRTTGQIFLFPYDATTNLGYEKGNLFVGKGQGDEYKLQSPDFPNENDADERTKGKDKEFELNQSLASNADKPYNYSFYINETSYKNQETNASDMTIALDVSGVEKDLAPKNTKFYFVRRNDLLKIPVLISDASTNVTVSQKHMPIGGLPIQLTFPDGAIISDQTVHLDHAGEVKIGYELKMVNNATDWSLKYYESTFQTGKQFCCAQVEDNKKYDNGEGLILEGDTITVGTDADTKMWTKLPWLGTEQNPVYGYKLTPDKVTVDGTEKDSPTSGCFTIRVQEVASGTAKIKLTLVATKDNNEVILPYTLTIKFGKKGGNA